MSEVIKVIIVGAGTSASVPKLNCISRKSPTCTVCQDAFLNGFESKNNRLNPSMLMMVRTAEGHIRNVLVDCGKTFRESVLKVFVPNGINSLHSVLLTHEHADASLGMDDLREFSSSKLPVVVHVDQKTETYMRQVYPYLFGEAKTWVAAVNWKQFGPTKFSGDTLEEGVTVEGVGIGVVPVIHQVKTRGTSNCFIIPLSGGGVLVHCTDIIELTEEALKNINTIAARLGGPPQEGRPTIRLLMLDMLKREECPVHFSVDQALEAAKRIGAERTIFIGMSCCLDYTAHNAEMNGVDPSYCCGFDGMCLFNVDGTTDLDA